MSGVKKFLTKEFDCGRMGFTVTKKGYKMSDKKGWYEVQDTDGNWHVVSNMQAAACRLEGVPTRYQTQGTKVCQAVANAVQND